MSTRPSRTMVQPINVIFKYLQTGTRVQIWLYDILDFRVEGKIMGFDEFMNVVLSDAEEIWVKKDNKDEAKNKRQDGDRKFLGRLLLKGENITLIQPAPAAKTKDERDTIPTQMEE